MGSEFEVVKRAVSAERAARYYGLPINNWTHRAKCPFHHGEHENLSFHAGRYHCFVCNASGTSIDFTMRHLGLSSAMDAARRLDRDFNLGLFDKKPMRRSSWSQSKAEESERLNTAFIHWCEYKYTEWRDTACRAAYTLRSGYSRRTHKEMLACGRKYALLRRFILGNEGEETARFRIFALVDDGRCKNFSVEREAQRLYNIFAAERVEIMQDIKEWKQSPSPIQREYARQMEGAYYLD